MTRTIEFYKWWILDERSGKRSLTRFRLSPVDAARAFPGAKPARCTLEVRYLPDAADAPASSRPDGEWFSVPLGS
ncbi:MAG TPA: hypothetical protein VGO85_02710 [Caldimonas sp.]|nr:hypothetical protein [Caldimonas sp.]